MLNTLRKFLIFATISLLAVSCHHSQPANTNTAAAPSNNPTRSELSSPDEHFKLSIPKNLVAVTQNNDPATHLHTELLTEQKYIDEAKQDPQYSANPLIALINRNAPLITLERNSNDWVNNKPDLKGYISQNVGDHKVKLLDYHEQDGDKYQIYFYTKQVQPKAKSELPYNIYGALWLDNGALYQLEYQGEDPVYKSYLIITALNYSRA